MVNVQSKSTSVDVRTLDVLATLTATSKSAIDCES